MINAEPGANGSFARNSVPSSMMESSVDVGGELLRTFHEVPSLYVVYNSTNIAFERGASGLGDFKIDP